jgi:serine/threonine protein kinase
MSAKNKRRILFPSPSVLNGAEKEPAVADFESLSKKALGEGAFGEVYKVRHKVSRELYAIKVVSKKKILDAELLPQLRREIRIMYSLSHPHIVKLYNHFEDDNNCYLVLELAEGGTLFQKLAKFKSFDEAAAAQYMREVILAVEYLHSRDPPIIHRDIKPENLLLDKEGRDGRIKLADFGWSNFFNSDRTRMTYCGTLDYLAPEMINQQGHSTNLDLWNLGVLLFELLTGTAPFQASNQQAMFEKILKVRINFPKNFPPLAKDLISKMLKVNPIERISIQEIMNHPWMQTHQPIRPTITQTVVKEPLPCNLEKGDEVDEDQTVKPFSESEFKVLSKPAEEEKKAQTPAHPTPKLEIPAAAPSAYTQQVSTLESELKQTRDENKKYRSQLEDKEAELERVKSKITELESVLTKLDQECEEKRKTEKLLKDQLAEKTSKIAELKALQEDENKLYQEYESLRAKCLEKETELSLLKTEIENMEKLAKEKVQQTEQIEKEIEKVKSEIDQTKQKYSRTKSEMHDQFLKLSTEVDVLQKELQSKERDSSVVSLEALLTFTQDNLEILKKRSKLENDLLKQYQEANERLIQLDNKYTEMKIQYENELAELRRKTDNELRELEANAVKIVEPAPEADLEILKQRLKESLENQYRNKAMFDELQHLQGMIGQYEKSLALAQRQLEDLDFLRENDQKIIKVQEGQLANYNQEIQEYKKKLEKKGK